MNEELLQEIKSTLPWLLAAALVVGGYYGVKNYRAAKKAAAAEAVSSAYTVEELEEAVSKHGSSDSGAALKVKLAKKLYDNGDYTNALDSYTALVGKVPAAFAGIPVVGRAQTLEALGRYDEALKEYDQFVAANPKSPLALTAKLGSARATALKGDREAALKTLADLKASFKDDPLSEARVAAVEDCVKRR